MKSRLIVASVATFLLGIAALKGAGGSDVADAVMKGNKTALRALLQQKADVNALRVDGSTALQWAVYRDDLEAIDLLIRAGAKVDAPNREGVTPLMMACLYGNVSMINKLVKAGADVKQRGSNGQTPIMLAAQKRRARSDQTADRRRGGREREGNRARHDGVDVGGRTEASRGRQGVARRRGRFQREVGRRRSAAQLHGRARQRGTGGSGGTAPGGCRGSRSNLRAAAGVRRRAGTVWSARRPGRRRERHGAQQPARRRRRAPRPVRLLPPRGQAARRSGRCR